MNAAPYVKALEWSHTARGFHIDNLEELVLLREREVAKLHELIAAQEREIEHWRRGMWGAAVMAFAIGTIFGGWIA